MLESARVEMVQNSVIFLFFFKVSVTSLGSENSSLQAIRKPLCIPTELVGWSGKREEEKMASPRALSFPKKGKRENEYAFSRGGKREAASVYPFSALALRELPTKMHG